MVIHSKHHKGAVFFIDVEKAFDGWHNIHIQDGTTDYEPDEIVRLISAEKCSQNKQCSFK